MKTPFLLGQQAPAHLKRKAPVPFNALATGMLASYLPGLFPSVEGGQLTYLGWMVTLLGCGVVVALPGPVVPHAGGDGDAFR